MATQETNHLMMSDGHVTPHSTAYTYTAAHVCMCSLLCRTMKSSKMRLRGHLPGRRWFLRFFMSKNNLLLPPLPSLYIGVKTVKRSIGLSYLCHDAVVKLGTWVTPMSTQCDVDISSCGNGRSLAGRGRMGVQWWRPSQYVADTTQGHRGAIYNHV
jgi:hypothetical protein